LYHGIVEHHRRAPVEHRFQYRLGLFYIDLDDLPSMENFMFGQQWYKPFRFCRSDYHRSEDGGLKNTVLETISLRTGRKMKGDERVMLLTQTRVLNFVFNPVSFYYVFDQDGKWIAVMAEINNTPWKERFSYIFLVEDGPYDTDITEVMDESSQDDLSELKGGVVDSRFQKEFHVSPFMQMDQEYHWNLHEPKQSLSIHMDNTDDENGHIFMADLQMQRKEFRAMSLLWLFICIPLAPMKTVLAIYWNALMLKLKGVPYVNYPGPVHSYERYVSKLKDHSQKDISLGTSLKSSSMTSFNYSESTCP
jgi:DUF1365 family protein